MNNLYDRTVGSLINLFGKRNSRNNKTESLKIEDGYLVFVGGSKYPSIPSDNIESVSYQPIDGAWQEINIKQKEQQSFNFYFQAEPDTLVSAVDKIQHDLKPAQPICQFILAAKQGSLSGKD